MSKPLFDDGNSEQLILIKSARDLRGLTPTFGPTFLDHHAGSILTDPRFAVTELVANAWDAGATRVSVVWPAKSGERFAVEDNGLGMTEAQFLGRWNQLNYDRQVEQGTTVVFPKAGKRRHRKAFGRNGIGRHAMFCFNDEYTVDTRAEGRRTLASIRRSYGAAPYRIEVLKTIDVPGHGTVLSCDASRWTLPVDDVAELLGSRFVSDPEFEIRLNGNTISLTDLEHISNRVALPVPGNGEVIVRRFDSDQSGRTSAQSGVAWWTNRRKVGMPSWEAPDGPLLDARTTVGKRLVYVVEADQLALDVKPDWSGYYASESTVGVQKVAYDFIRSDLHGALEGMRKERKREALAANRSTILSLPPLSQEAVAQFIEDIQVRSPTISPKDLSNAVQVLSSLEQSRSGFRLLERLAHLSPDALDGLNEILAEWSIADVKAVLGELRYRLRLIRQLEELVEKHTADELHDLQPIFERGLWIFGPEFESISFTSNRSLATVIAKYFGSATIEAPTRRPDFVVLPDSSLGSYSSDAFDKNHEVSGLAAVVIVELKRGGFTVSHPEKDQAMGYSRAIRQSGKVSRDTRVTCYVLGTEVDPNADEEQYEGATVIIPRTYQTVLRQAHARTFNLLEKVESSEAVRVTDPELRDAIGDSQPPLGSDLI
jgi:hypothetical protein